MAPMQKMQKMEQMCDSKWNKCADQNAYESFSGNCDRQSPVPSSRCTDTKSGKVRAGNQTGQSVSRTLPRSIAFLVCCNSFPMPLDLLLPVDARFQLHIFWWWWWREELGLVLQHVLQMTLGVKVACFRTNRLGPFPTQLAVCTLELAHLHIRLDNFSSAELAIVLFEAGVRVIHEK